jgi:hypothetical protein
MSAPPKAASRPSPTRVPERQLRARLKRDLAAGRVALVEVLSERPACAQTAKVRELLLAVPGIGPAKARRGCCERRRGTTSRFMGRAGIEPATLGLKVPCSTD